MAVVKRYSKKLNKTVEYYTTVLTFSTSDDLTLYKDFCFLYGEDVIKKFVKRAMKKAVDKKDFLEFTLFDDVDDFLTYRMMLTQK